MPVILANNTVSGSNIIVHAWKMLYGIPCRLILKIKNIKYIAKENAPTNSYMKRPFESVLNLFIRINIQKAIYNIKKADDKKTSIGEDRLVSNVNSFKSKKIKHSIFRRIKIPAIINDVLLCFNVNFFECIISDFLIANMNFFDYTIKKGGKQ